MKLEKLIQKVTDGFNPIVKFSGEEYKIKELKYFGEKLFIIISKPQGIKQLMISINNKDLKF